MIEMKKKIKGNEFTVWTLFFYGGHNMSPLSLLSIKSNLFGEEIYAHDTFQGFCQNKTKNIKSLMLRQQYKAEAIKFQTLKGSVHIHIWLVGSSRIREMGVKCL